MMTIDGWKTRDLIHLRKAKGLSVVGKFYFILQNLRSRVSWTLRSLHGWRIMIFLANYAFISFMDLSLSLRSSSCQ